MQVSQRQVLPGAPISLLIWCVYRVETLAGQTCLGGRQEFA